MKKIIFLTLLIVHSTITFAEIQNYTFSSLGSVNTGFISPASTNTVDYKVLSNSEFLFINSNSFDTSASSIEVNQDAHLVSKVMSYPNPFSLSKNTDAFIGYLLSGDMDIQIKVYSQNGVFVGQKDLRAGIDEGAIAGYNKVALNRSFFGYSGSAGIYFYFLIHDSKIIAKSKMAVLP